MARKATGAVVEHQARDGRTYRSLRFTAYGKRRFVSLGPVSEAEAQRELRHVLADVERGSWCPPAAVEPPPEPEPIPTFDEFAGQWWIRNERQLTAGTLMDYRWRLQKHLLPFFADTPIDKITFDLVERYIASKLKAEKPLSARSINMTVTLMGQILEGAVERELITRNPARGKPRRVRERAPRRSYLETAEQIVALLDAAGELDRAARPGYRHVHRRAIIATLVLAGLRVSELCELRWRDVDLANGWIHIGESKTPAGRRKIKIRGALRDELVTIRPAGAAANAFVFATSTGRAPGRDNIRNRVVVPAVETANERLIAAGESPLPEKLTPHSMRRTFASVLYALGEDPGVVMDEMGHTNPALALRIYRQSMRRGDDEKQRLRALVDGAEVADMGRRRSHVPDATAEREAA